jgi:hypothetical protein
VASEEEGEDTHLASKELVVEGDGTPCEVVSVVNVDVVRAGSIAAAVVAVFVRVSLSHYCGKQKRLHVVKQVRSANGSSWEMQKAKGASGGLTGVGLCVQGFRH